MFVSDRTHMLRVLRMARDQGIDGLRLADDDEPDRVKRRRSRSKDTIHEIGGLGLYFLTGTGL